MVKRFDIWLVGLDPNHGSEIGKTRPCAVVSPDSMNAALRTVIVAPMTTARKGWPSRVATAFRKKSGEIALDQLGAIDKSKLGRRVGRLDSNTQEAVCAVLVEMFAYD